MLKRSLINGLCWILVALMFSGCGTSGMNPETTAVYVESGSEIVIHGEPRLERPLWETDGDTLTVDEMLERVDCIVDAKFMGYYYMADHDKLAFQITNVYRGEFNEANEVILVNPLEIYGYLNLEPGERPSYKLGQEFLLFLSKYEASVYFPHDQYGQWGDYYLNETSKQWDEVHAYVEQQIAAGVGPEKKEEKEEQKFTASSELAEILALAPDVFVMSVDALFGGDVNISTENYWCTVTQVLKGEPNQNGTVLIPLFEGSVKIGESYVFLVRPATEDSYIYHLVSSKHSVFTMEEAQQLPELAALLENAVPYNAPDAAE